MWYLIRLGNKTKKVSAYRLEYFIFGNSKKGNTLDARRQTTPTKIFFGQEFYRKIMKSFSFLLFFRNFVKIQRDGRARELHVEVFFFWKSIFFEIVFLFCLFVFRFCLFFFLELVLGNFKIKISKVKKIVKLQLWKVQKKKFKIQKSKKKNPKNSKFCQFLFP